MVLVASDTNLQRAITLALGPWDLVVESVEDENPGPTMPGSSERGREIAERHSALAVVWVSESEDGGTALWVFDHRSDRVLARPLRIGQPFDAPTAAQVALIVKTLLRTAVPMLAPDVVTPHANPEAESEPARVVPKPSTTWSLLVAAGARGRATAPAAVEPRLMVGVTVWPRKLAQALGLSLVLESGPGLEFDDDVRGRWTESSLMFAVRARVPFGRRVDMGATLGAGLRFTTLGGRATPGDAHIELRRLDPTSRIELELGAAVSERVRLELRVGAQFPWRVQRYFVGSDLAFEVTNASVQALIGLEFRIR